MIELVDEWGINAPPAVAENLFEADREIGEYEKVPALD